MCLPVNDEAAGPVSRCRIARPCAAMNSSPRASVAGRRERAGADRSRGVPAGRADRTLLLRELRRPRRVRSRRLRRRLRPGDVGADVGDTPREAVERFVALMVDDPVRGRVLLLAPAVEPVLVASGAEWMPSFIDLLQHKLTRIADPVRADNGRHQPDRRPHRAVHRVPGRATGGHPRAVHRLLRRHAAQPGPQLH